MPNQSRTLINNNDADYTGNTDTTKTIKYGEKIWISKV